jgi:hypothetical protein
MSWATHWNFSPEVDPIDGWPNLCCGWADARGTPRPGVLR